ncbi:DUF222 domain-containing protein [Pseudarthrobacter sp. W1I19]|uniref:DUF222 domain-containing protein n=1 Tax=Pseudarthrobacter sp. W1I19 TaxID=3042288 RepID=UPI0027D8E479|nr:DUF222 domain-containing protein [Pseudarthrobacter sp. W1I19]
MEAIGERPEYYGGNVVVLGRAGVVASSGALDLSGPAAGASRPISGSCPNAYDDGTPLRPGWHLHAVPTKATQAGAASGASAASEAEPTQADSAAATSVTGPAHADSELAAPTESESQPVALAAEHTQADSEPAALAAEPVEADSEPAASATGPTEAGSAPAGSVTGPVPADSLLVGEPLGLAELGRLLAQAAAAAPSILAGASYVEAANYAAGVEDLSRTMEYLQVLCAGTVDRTRTQAIAAADAARASRSHTRTGPGTGKGWVTGWDNGVETLNETDTHWPGGSTPCDTGTVSATDSRDQVVTSPADDGCANTAESLRLLLRIGKSEANRRLALAKDILPATTLTGDTIPAARQHLATALTPTNTSLDILNTDDSTNTSDEDQAEQPAACPAVSSRAGTIIALTLNRLQHLTTPEKLALIEENLTTTAATADPDFLARVARRWADTIDADGTEPSEEALRHTQGAFIRKPRHGLHHLEIFATTDQYEHLLTVMNTATNPRTTTPMHGTLTAAASATGAALATATETKVDGTGTTGSQEHASQDHASQDGSNQDGVWNETNTGPDLDRRTRPQKQLDGLVSAAKTALATNTLPTTGGNRPQIIATINYQHLLPHHTSATNIPTGTETSTGTTPRTSTPPGPGTEDGNGNGTHPNGSETGTGTGNFVFTGPVAAATLRKIACDADIIPAILGTHGELLDLGRKTRLFTLAQRTALTTRDQGCAFPNCTIPAPWCEAHHITYWSHGGPTNIDNGVLLCSGHHHLIHKEQWTITTTNNTPWFTPPKHLDPHQKPQQNTYFKPPPPPTPRE